jgi:hypothetical protein
VAHTLLLLLPLQPLPLLRLIVNVSDCAFTPAALPQSLWVR